MKCLINDRNQKVLEVGVSLEKTVKKKSKLLALNELPLDEENNDWNSILSGKTVCSSFTYALFGRN
jgi:hypothetical protein